MDTSFLCAELGEILSEELSVGNEISDIIKGGWTKVNVIVYLKFPFRKNYQNGLNSADVTFFSPRRPALRPRRFIFVGDLQAGVDSFNSPRILLRTIENISENH